MNRALPVLPQNLQEEILEFWNSMQFDSYVGMTLQDAITKVKQPLLDIIEGLQWCIDNKIQVANMSFGTLTDVQSLHDAVIAAKNAGIVLVAAAGNSGPGDNSVCYPAKYPEAIAVSAADNNDNLASWSSRGTEVILAAPGVNIYSTYKSGDYKTLSGTSMATPHVTATAALIIASGITDSNNDGIINDEVLERLLNTSEDLGIPGKDDMYGYGLVNTKKAVDSQIIQ